MFFNGGTTYRQMMATMTAKPMSCPMKVDMSYRPGAVVADSLETSTPRTRLASVAESVSTDDLRSPEILSLCCLS